MSLMRKSRKGIVVGLVAACVWGWMFTAVVGWTAAQVYQPNWESLDRRPVPQWFLDAKFGIFINWGLYSVPGWGVRGQYAEWYWYRIHNRRPGNPWWEYHKRVWGEDFPYPKFAELFRAENFDPDFWADLFVRSGARYVVFDSKHHDGFCLWPSREASRNWGRPWNSVETGPHRDLVQEVATAVRRRGLRFGVYYSLYEWFNPLWLKDRAQYVRQHMIPQFKDLVQHIRPAIVWADGEWSLRSDQWHSPELLAWLYNESPCREYVVVNDRWGKDCRHRHGGFYTTEYGTGLPGPIHAWEENRGMAYSYGWNRAETVDDYRTAQELILMLCDLVSRGGNFLLNVGPTGDGRIPVIMQERLIQIGRWLQINGEAIYGTRFAGRACQWTSGPRPEQQFKQFRSRYPILELTGQEPKNGHAVKQVFFTRKGTTLFAMTAGWPGRELVLKALTVPKGTVIHLLGFDSPIPWKQQGNCLVFDLSSVDPTRLPTRYVYTFRIPQARFLEASRR